MRGTICTGAVSLFIVLISVVTSSQGGYLAQSTFTTGHEDWSVGTTKPMLQGPATWNAEGYICTDDLDEYRTGFAAPDVFAGDKSLAYGEELTFDLSPKGSSQSTHGFVLLASNLHAFVRSFPMPLESFPVWTPVSIDLTESGWEDFNSPGNPVTPQAFQEMLGDMVGLGIFIEIQDGTITDEWCLDNVVMTPEPFSLGLLGMGSIWCRRRRRMH